MLLRLIWNVGAGSLAALAVFAQGASVATPDSLDKQSIRGGACTYSGYSNVNCSTFGAGCSGMFDAATTGGTSHQKTGQTHVAGACNGGAACNGWGGNHNTDTLTTVGCGGE